MQETRNTWWNDFFSGLTAEIVARLASPEQTEQEASFIEQRLGRQAGHLIGDFACGDGRLSLELARRGYRTRGVDISATLIDKAKAAVVQAAVPAEFVRGDMREIAWMDELDGAYCFGNSFGYFDDRGNRAFLERVHRAIKPGGRLILQTNLLAESLLTRPLSRAWYELGDLLFCHAASYEPKTSTLTSEYRVFGNGAREKKTAYFRIYTLRELLELVKLAGFTGTEALGSLFGDPYKTGDPALYLICQR